MTKLERTKRILGTRTETETIDRALDLLANEAALVAALTSMPGGRWIVFDTNVCRSRRSGRA